MSDTANLVTRAVKAHRVGGIYYSVLEVQNRVPADLGKQLIDDIPTGSEAYDAWKYRKIQFFHQEDTRLISIPELVRLPKDLSDNPFGGYMEKPQARLPLLPVATNWVYVVDLDEDALSVAVPRLRSRRVFCLKNIPRWLFEPHSTPATGGDWMENDYRMFVDPVDRIHLATAHASPDPDPAHIALYERCAPRIQHLPQVVPGADTLPVRKYLRLVLLKLFLQIHLGTFSTNFMPEGTNLDCMFRQFAYAIVNLARSSVEVGFLLDRTPRTGTRKPRITPQTVLVPSSEQPKTAEYWVDGVLVIVNNDITTMDNLHAAIGKAVQITNARGSSSTSQVTTSAIIFSFAAIVLVTIRGEEVSHTTNIPLFLPFTTHHTEMADSGVLLALLAIFYKLPPPLQSQSHTDAYQNLPTEIFQNIFGYVSPATRSTMQVSCRLFRGISEDYGLRVGTWYLQRSAEYGRNSFIATTVDTLDESTQTSSRLFPRRSVVDLVRRWTGLSPIYDVMLYLPGGHAMRLELPLLRFREVHQSYTGLGL